MTGAVTSLASPRFVGTPMSFGGSSGGRHAILLDEQFARSWGETQAPISLSPPPVLQRALPVGNATVGVLAVPEGRGAVETLEKRMFDTRMALKIKASPVAMHLGREWLNKLFAQIDALLDPDEWDPADSVPSTESFATFLRMVVFLSPRRRPSLGATSDGNIVAVWVNDAGRLTIECRDSDVVRWGLFINRDGSSDSAVGTTSISRLPEVLSPYDPESWFGRAV